MSPSLHLFLTRETRYHNSAKGEGLTLFQVWLHRQNCSSPNRPQARGREHLHWPGDTKNRHGVVHPTSFRQNPFRINGYGSRQAAIFRFRAHLPTLPSFPDCSCRCLTRLVCHCHSGQAVPRKRADRGVRSCPHPCSDQRHCQNWCLLCATRTRRCCHDLGSPVCNSRN